MAKAEKKLTRAEQRAEKARDPGVIFGQIEEALGTGGEELPENLRQLLPVSLPDALLSAELFAKNGGQRSEKAEEIRKKLKKYLNEKTRIDQLLDEAEANAASGWKNLVDGQSNLSASLWQTYQNISYYQRANNEEKDLHDDATDLRVSTLFEQLSSQKIIQDKIREEAERAANASDKNDRNWAMHLPSRAETTREALDDTEFQLARFEGAAEGNRKGLFTSILQRLGVISKSPKADIKERIPPMASPLAQLEENTELAADEASTPVAPSAPVAETVPVTAEDKITPIIDGFGLDDYAEGNAKALTQNYETLSAVALEAELKSIREEMKGFMGATQHHNRQFSKDIFIYSNPERYEDYLKHEATQGNTGMAFKVGTEKDITAAEEFSQKASPIHDQYQTRINAIQTRLNTLHAESPGPATRAMTMGFQHAQLIFNDLRIVSQSDIGIARRITTKRHEDKTIGPESKENTAENSSGVDAVLPIINSQLQKHEENGKELASKADLSAEEAKTYYSDLVKGHSGVSHLLDQWTAAKESSAVKDPSLAQQVKGDVASVQADVTTRLSKVSDACEPLLKASVEVEARRLKGLNDLVSEFKKSTQEIVVPDLVKAASSHRQHINGFLSEKNLAAGIKAASDKANQKPEERFDEGISQIKKIIEPSVRVKKDVAKLKGLTEKFVKNVKGYDEDGFSSEIARQSLSTLEGDIVESRKTLIALGRWVITDADIAAISKKVNEVRGELGIKANNDFDQYKTGDGTEAKKATSQVKNFNGAGEEALRRLNLLPLTNVSRLSIDDVKNGSAISAAFQRGVNSENETKKKLEQKNWKRDRKRHDRAAKLVLKNLGKRGPGL